MESPRDTLVIGGGQAGLAMSRWLQKLDVPHAVLERGRIGNTWRTQRWDSFHLNTPNVVNQLPDDKYAGDGAFEFDPHTKLLDYFEEYRSRHGLPVEEGVDVTSVRPVDGGFEVETSSGRRHCRNVVLCGGDQNVPRVPAVARQLPEDVIQLHAAEYRNPHLLPTGAVLVVGSGQSGAQIVEDLLENGRNVFLSTSAVGRAPRVYRGKDLFRWLQLSGLFDQRPEDLEDPNEVHARQLLISGTRGGHTVSLQQLARDGATLLGRLRSVTGRVLSIDGDLEANVAKGDEVSAKIRGLVDMAIAKAELDVPPPEPDTAEEPFDGIAAMATVRRLDLDEAGIRSVIWATGFGARYDYLDATLLDDTGRPRHDQGVCEVPGLYCLGFTWLRRRISGLLPGVGDDAEHIARHIAERNRAAD